MKVIRKNIQRIEMSCEVYSREMESARNFLFWGEDHRSSSNQNFPRPVGYLLTWSILDIR